MSRTDAASDRLRALLAAARNADGGWPYYASRKSRIEPTSWALLALGDPGAAALLEGWRSASGLLVEPGMPGVNYMFNALAALALAPHRTSAGQSADGDPAARALLAHRGEKAAVHPAIRQNPNLQGWSWTDGTFSWVEPTAWCMVAVKKLARPTPEAGARVAEAEKVLEDRVCSGGGWNYGNPEVYGKNLVAHVPPTAAGVLALQNRVSEPFVQQALGFLLREGGREGSTTAMSLAWLASAVVHQPVDQFVTKLIERLPVAESTGNLASMSMMLYVLDQHERHALPTALRL